MSRHEKGRKQEDAYKKMLSYIMTESYILLRAEMFLRT